MIPTASAAASRASQDNSDINLHYEAHNDDITEFLYILTSMMRLGVKTRGSVQNYA